MEDSQSGEIERQYLVQDLLTEALDAAWQSILERELYRQVQQCVVEQCLAASMAAIEMAHVNREPEPADPATTSSWQPNQQPAPCLPDTWMRGVVQVRQLLPERTGTGEPCSSCMQVNVVCPIWNVALLLLTCAPACGAADLSPWACRECGEQIPNTPAGWQRGDATSPGQQAAESGLHSIIVSQQSNWGWQAGECWQPASEQLRWAQDRSIRGCSCVAS